MTRREFFSAVLICIVGMVCPDDEEPHLRKSA